MKEKCKKYEGLFLFSDEKALEEHVKSCPDCQREREKEKKLSALIKDSEYEYRKLAVSNLNKSYAKIACILLLFVGIGTMTSFRLYNGGFVPKSVYTADVSVIETIGLPTDEYGFFDYN